MGGGMRPARIQCRSYQVITSATAKKLYAKAAQVQSEVNLCLPWFASLRTGATVMLNDCTTSVISPALDLYYTS